MKSIEVDEEACIGCEQCVEICPQVFEMIAGKAMAVTPERCDECDVAEAAELCPVGAISIEE